MLNVLICVGSSCHIKGSAEIVGLFQKKIEEYNLKDKLALGGSFCAGKCNRDGVTVQVGDEVFVGVTRDGFNDFFTKHVLTKIK